MFTPPRCPNTGCKMHCRPIGRFYHRCGFYKPNCQPAPIQRFRCRKCHRSFSRQTFRVDYFDHRPRLNPRVISRLCSGTGLRQTARELGITLWGLQKKVKKLCRQLGYLHANLLGQFESPVAFLFDELETFEGCRSTRPLTVPILIERDSMFIVGACSGPIPPSGKMTPRRRTKIERHERRHGKRPNRSRQLVASVLQTTAEHSVDCTEILIDTDEKKTYPKLIREAFGEDRVTHRTTSSKRLRDSSNPLFRINLTNALARDRMARLHRRSWCVSKRSAWLDGHLSMWLCYRNYHRNRTNKDHDLTPAMACGFVDAPLSKGQMVKWRQDWGPDRSIHPLARWCESVSEMPRHPVRGVPTTDK